MAASNNRDVKMTLSVETLGAENIKKLQDSIEKLATEGGDAAPEFQKLADEIGRLGEQSSALQALRQLANETETLAEKQTQASVSAGELGVKLQAAERVTASAAAAQKNLAASLSELQLKAKETRDSLDLLTAQTAEAKKADESYAVAVSDLKVKKIEQRAEIEKLKSALADATAEVKQAEAAENKLAASYEYVASQAKAAEAALQVNKNSVKAAADAANALNVATDDVASSQAALVQGLNNAGQAALQTKAAIDQYQEKLRAAKVEADTTATAAKDAADKISNAFKTVGVRSAEELRAEIAQVREAMNTVKVSAAATGSAVDGAFKAGQARIKELERDIREVSGTLTMTDKAAGLLKNSMGQITAGNIVADGVGYLVNKVKELGVAFLGAIVDGDQMRRGLNAIYKDAEVTASQIDFLRRSSSESGVAFGQLSKEFVKFSASMQLSNVPLEQSNNLFKAVTAATASLGLGTEATAGALNALGQMASKGTVSLEELRQQLGDRLPGAIGLTAQGLGITEAQLIKLVESGGLATRDFIVPFTEALGKLKGETDGLVPAFDRLKGTLSEVAQGMGDAGGTQTLLLALKVLGGALGSLVLGLSTIVEYIFLCAKTWGILVASIVTVTNPMEALNKVLSDSTGRLAKQAEALTNFINPSEAAAASTKKHADAMTANTAEVVKSINANASLSAEQKLVALSTALAADATLNASSKMVQYNVAATELISKQIAQTDAYTKTSKAAKEQGDTLVSLAKLTGDAAAIQTASIQAAEMYSAALDKVAVSQAAETAMLVAQKDELEKYRIAQGLTIEQIKVQADALDKKIIASQAETEQSKQSALAQKAELFERQLAVAVLKDHSAQVDNFKKSMQDATITLKEYERLALNGKKSEAEVTEARKAVTAATVLYKNAVADLISKIELEAKAKSTSLQLSAAQSKAGADHSLALAAQARALGDTATAIYYEIKAREQNIATMKLEIQIRDLEAKAALATIALKQKDLDLTTDEGRKNLEIMEIEKKVIEIKLLANGATKDAIAAMEREITALRDGVDLRGQSTSSIDRETGARNSNRSATDEQADAMDRLAMKYTLSANYTERQIKLLEREAEASEKAAAAERKRLNVDKDKFSLDGNGNRVTGVETEAQLTKRVGDKYGAEYAKDPNAIKLANLSMQLETIRQGAYNSSGSNSPAVAALLDEFNKTEQALNKTKVEAAATSAPAFNRPTGAPAPALASAGQTVLVKIDLGGGKSYDVNTASARDASQLQGFMGALQDARRGAGM